MKKYKIVFIDIDDTLNPSNKEVSNVTKKVMKELKDKGIKLVLNTGRSNKYAILKAKEAGLSEYVISSNGSLIYNYESEECLFSKEINEKDIKWVYDYCMSHDMTLILNSYNERYINNKEYKYNGEEAIYFDDIDKLLRNTKVNQMVILSSNFDRMLVLPNLFKEKLPQLQFVHSSVNLKNGIRTKGKEYYHDLVVENTSKSSGIVELLDFLNIDSNEAIAIGNGYDDLCMRDVVGTFVAVNNAIDMLKEVADYVTDSSENDGVAKILEKICLEKK